MNTLQEILAVVGVVGPVFDRFPYLYGKIPPERRTTMQFVGNLFSQHPLFSGDEQKSMRAMMSRLESLSPDPISLDVEIVGPSSGKVPFDPEIRVHASSGVVLTTFVTLLDRDQAPVDAGEDFGDPHSPFFPYRLKVPGVYFVRVTRVGLPRTGVVVVEKLLRVEAE